MKKKEFFAIVALMALVGVFVACNNDDECQTQNKSELFADDLSKLNDDQQRLIDELRNKSITRASQTDGGTKAITYDSLMNCARAIEEIAIEFINNHKDELALGVPVAMSDEEYDILLADVDEMKEYINDNFSQAFACEFQSYLTTGVRNHNLDIQMSPFELFALQNITAEYELQNLADLICEGEQQKPIESEKERACQSMFNYKKNLCTLMSGFVELSVLCAAALAGVGGSVVASPFGGGYAATVVGTAGSTAALAAYITCINNAQADYNNCMSSK